MHNLRFTSLLLAIVCSMALAVPASADIVLEFTESVDGGVTVVGTGSGFTTGPRATSDLDVSNFATLFLLPSAGTDEINASITTGLLTNVTTGVSRDIINFSVDSDGSTPPPSDDLEFTTGGVGPVEFVTGDEFTITIDATFNVDQLSFSDLVVGTHVDAAQSSGDEIFGVTTINIAAAAVPEPTSVAVVAMCLSAGCLRRRR